MTEPHRSGRRLVVVGSVLVDVMLRVDAPPRLGDDVLAHGTQVGLRQRSWRVST